MENFKFLLLMIKKRPLRFILTTLQIALGVLAAALIFNIHFGLTDMINNTASQTSEEFLQVSIFEEEKMEDGNIIHAMGNKRLSSKLLQELANNTNSILGISSQNYFHDLLLVDKNLYRPVGAFSAGASFNQTFPLEFINGSFYTEAEEKDNKTVISEALAKTLFGTTDVLGETIGVTTSKDSEPTNYLVTGVFKELPPTITMLLGPVNMVLTPPSYMISESFVEFSLRIEKNQFSEIKSAIEELVFQECGPEAKVTIDTAQTLLNQIKSSTDSFLKILGILAFAAVVVSSIGILSIMLVNILERTREIGLRRALGATKGTIFGQMLYESIMLSNIGGFMGLILAAIVSRFFNVGKILNFMYINMQTTQSSLSWQAALLSLALASIVGGLFGIYPAYQAAQYSPVESLRD